MELLHHYLPQTFKISPQEKTALTLLSTIHHGMDWETWGGLTYWERFKERIILARYAGTDLKSWWQKINQEMGITYTKETRNTAATIINENDPQILATLTQDTDYLITLLRICVDQKKPTKGTPQDELPL